jgi:hypothetical protein
MHVNDLTRHSKTLSAELHDLAETFKHHAVTLEAVNAVLQDRAYTLLIIILALPFCSPVTIPGLSTPLGLVIAIVAGRLALGLPPWLPRRLLQLRLPPRFFRMVLKGTSRTLGLLERMLRPRLPALTATPLLVRLHALLVCVAALTLMIPAPLPFSNTLPALGILLVASGTMERDGAAIIAGYFFTVVGVAYFALIALLGAGAWNLIRNRLGGFI